MAKRPTNRIKYKIWGEDSSTEFDGSIAEGLYYGAWSLSVVDRQQLIDRLIEQQKKSPEPVTLRYVSLTLTARCPAPQRRLHRGVI